MTRDEQYAGVRKIIQELPDGLMEEDMVGKATCDYAIAILDLLNRAGADAPQVFWHGGDAVVLTWAIRRC